MLLLRRSPTSQAELARILNVSRSLISGSVAELAKLGLLRPMSGHRNAPYRAVVDVWPAISDVLRSREWMLLEAARGALEAATEEAELNPGSQPKYDLARMKTLLTMTEVAQSLLKILIRMRQAPSPAQIGGWLRKARTWMRGLA